MKKAFDITDGLVVNLHYTDACNYRCRFCHSHFKPSPLSLTDWKHIIDGIAREVRIRRFNLAGGEPLASPYIQPLIDHIHSLGIDCSIITNGSLLTPEFIRRNRNKLSMIGISVDAVSRSGNLAIGRANAAGRTLSEARLAELAREIHADGITLKINTVVNALNAETDFSDLIGELKPERWKILRMIHIDGANDFGRELLVTDGQYREFVRRHRALSPVAEDTDDIIHAYIVVNPDGRLIDNSNGRYRIGKSLLSNSFADELQRIGLNVDKYLKRYRTAAA